MTNVRELLELERNLYQENINRNQENLRALEKGTFHEFLEQCIPFRNTRDKVLQVALNHLHLMQRNQIDLLEFELQSANDIFESAKSSLNQNLFLSTKNKLEKVKKAEEIAAPIQDGHYREDQKLSASIFSDQKQRLHLNFDAMKKAFDFQHLEPCLPTRDLVWKNLQLEIEAMKAYNQRRSLTRTPSSINQISLLTSSRMKINSVTFRIGQQVIVYSQLCDEELLGIIYELSEQNIKVKLVCQTIIAISLDRLKDGEIKMYPETSEKIAYQTTLSDPKCETYRKRKRLYV
ncbi:unnamed protein product [Albugo candida]|uniref:Uncharacterized protein n=1 Tax=Albugo candida TaxID=65357 RepID=A0A024GU60_9STRA|nr:unnamed protein product [Albugo candida]|eukprot:CCI49893.1 unnamed protein product [Albugo candida]